MLISIIIEALHEGRKKNGVRQFTISARRSQLDLKILDRTTIGHSVMKNKTNYIKQSKIIRKQCYFSHLTYNFCMI